MDIGALFVATSGTWMMLQWYAANWATLQPYKLTRRLFLALAEESFGLTKSSVLDLKQTSLNAEVKVWEFILVLIIKMQESLALVSQENDNSPPHYLHI